jgi:RNA polymerase-binding protein DksA
MMVRLQTMEIEVTEDKREQLRAALLAKKAELSERLERISANLQRGFNADSKEMAKELEDSEVVDALGNEARDEVRKISAALVRLDDGSYGRCTECGEAIEEERLMAYPYADECIDCATFDERRRRRT